MPAYYGAKQLFRNRLSTRPVREIYLGTNRVMGYANAQYSADEITTKAINNVEKPPTIKGTGSAISVSTTGYASGYAYSKYYCDRIEATMMYAGNYYFYDSSGNTIVSIECDCTFSYATARWTLSCKASVLGKQIINTSKSSSNMDSNRLAIKIYYNFTTSQWNIEYGGSTYASDTTEWQPTYFCVMPQMWFIISQYDSQFFNGTITLTKIERAYGYPQAKT